jgi:hypothetical protein
MRAGNEPYSVDFVAPNGDVLYTFKGLSDEDNSQYLYDKAIELTVELINKNPQLKDRLKKKS